MQRRVAAREARRPAAMPARAIVLAARSADGCAAASCDAARWAARGRAARREVGASRAVATDNAASSWRPWARCRRCGTACRRSPRRSARAARPRRRRRTSSAARTPAGRARRTRRASGGRPAPCSSRRLRTAADAALDADQVVAAVGGGPEHHAVAGRGQRGCGGDEVADGQRRAVRVEQARSAMPGIQQRAGGVEQAGAEIGLHGLDQTDAAGRCSLKNASEPAGA